MKKLIFIFILCLNFSASIAHAENLQDILYPNKNYPEDRLLNGRNFKDSGEMREALKEQGIRTASLNFQTYQVMCQPAFRNGFEAFYNCQFLNVIREAIYNRDSEICDDDAYYEFPDNLRRLNTNQAIMKFDSAYTEVQNYAAPIIINPIMTKSDLRRLRMSYYDKCMRSKSWSEPRNWKAGRIY